MVVGDFEVDGLLRGVGAELGADFAHGGQKRGGGIIERLAETSPGTRPAGPGTSPSLAARRLADRSCHSKGARTRYSRDAHCVSSLLGIGSTSSLRPARWS